jgi:hypothetical protein
LRKVPRASPRLLPGPSPAPLRSSSSRGALGVLAAVLLSACQIDPPLIHPDFQDLCAWEVGVPPVENRTLHDLSAVSIAGPLQRLTLGEARVDVPAALRQALLGGLEKKGYRAVALEAGGGPGSTPLLLRSEIGRFRREAATMGGSLEIAGMLELVRSGGSSGEDQVLFRQRFDHRTATGGRSTRTPQDLEQEVGRAGLAALRDLPACAKAGRGPGAAGGR